VTPADQPEPTKMLDAPERRPKLTFCAATNKRETALRRG
jgi:hypothetical protein